MKTVGLLTTSVLLCVGALAEQQVTVNLPSKSDNIKVPSYFQGFSLELTQMNDYFGKDPDHRDPIFMQLLRNIKDRTGSLMLRVGGNSQDTAFPDEAIVGGIQKTNEQAQRTDSAATTFNVKVSRRVFDVMAGVSSVTGAKWMFGLNFEDANNMDSAKYLGKAAVETLGDNLFAIQIGNEPDLYAKHGMRTADWGIPQYVNEWTNWASTLHDEFGSSLKKNDIFTGAVICCSWNISDVLHANIIETGRNKEFMNSLTVQKYSSNNCFGKPKGDYTDYLNHEWIVKTPKDLYTEAAKTANAAGKMLIMGETNTAACGGLPGVSDTFVSTLWGVDWLLNLASIGFSSAALQIGGKTTKYNPMYFVNGTWKVAPIYYSSLLIAEAVGTDKGAQFENIDLSSTTLSSYAVFHQDALKYAILLNTDINQDAVFKLKGGWSTLPSEVKVKRLLASHFEEKNNITWGGQTFNGALDGQLKGERVLETVKCDSDGCTIRLPPTSVAVVGADIDTVVPTMPTESSSNNSAKGNSKPNSVSDSKNTGSITNKPSLLLTSTLVGLIGVAAPHIM